MTAGGHLSNDEFFARLADLLKYRTSREHGSVHLSQKPLTFGQDNPAPDLGGAITRQQLAPIVIRASDGKGKWSKSDRGKTKLSTVVEPASIGPFYARYADVCKAGMPALKPRDKLRKKEKAKARRRKAEGGGGAKADVKAKADPSTPAAGGGSSTPLSR